MGHLDWAATRLAVAIERVAEALLVEEEEAQQHIVASCCGRGHDRRSMRLADLRRAPRLH
jgi:hypothetical protein